MAKEEKKKSVNFNDVTEENIVEQIKSANKFSEEVKKKADEMAKEEKSERQARELNEIRDKATYVNLKSVLRSRLVNAQKRAIDGARKETLALLDKVVKGEMTANEYDKAVSDTIVEANKKIEEAKKEYHSNSKELQQQFPSSWRYDWDNPFNRITSV
jgi:polyhydroxyalkanoate synthesis regulator phasin